MGRQAILAATLMASMNLIVCASAKAQDLRPAPGLADRIEQLDLRVRRPRPSLCEAQPRPALSSYCARACEYRRPGASRGHEVCAEWRFLR